MINVVILDGTTIKLSIPHIENLNIRQELDSDLFSLYYQSYRISWGVENADDVIELAKSLINVINGEFDNNDENVYYGAIYDKDTKKNKLAKISYITKKENK